MWNYEKKSNKKLLKSEISENLKLSNSIILAC